MAQASAPPPNPANQIVEPGIRKEHIQGENKKQQNKKFELLPAGQVQAK